MRTAGEKVIHYFLLKEKKEGRREENFKNKKEGKKVGYLYKIKVILILLIIT